MPTPEGRTLHANLHALDAIALWATLALLGVSLFHVPPFLLTGIALVVMGLGPLGAAFFLWDKALKLGDPRQIGILSYITPLASTALLIVFTGRSLSVSTVVAAALIIGAAIAGTRVREDTGT